MPTYPELPGQEVVNRFPNDERLREAGWEIWSRPQNGPAVWVRGFTEEEALAITTAYEQVLESQQPEPAN